MSLPPHLASAVTGDQHNPMASSFLCVPWGNATPKADLLESPPVLYRAGVCWLKPPEFPFLRLWPHRHHLVILFTVVTGLPALLVSHPTERLFLLTQSLIPSLVVEVSLLLFL